MLAAVAVAQLAFIGYRVATVPASTGESASDLFAVGDTVRAVRGSGSTDGLVDGLLDAPLDGSFSLPLRREDGRWTLLLTFHPECLWCEAAAPHWTEWLSVSRPFDVVGVTSDSAAGGLQYFGYYGWTIDVFSTGEAEAESVEARLTSRTPWAYLFDSNGVLRYQGNGADLSPVETAWSNRQ